MKLTTKGRYAVTAMLDLAIYTQGGPVSLPDVAKRQSISLSYLEQLFSKLRRAGLVVSMRGPGGGYRINGSLEDIAIADILAAVDDSVDATACGGMSNCQDNKRCLTHDLWTDLSKQIQSFLSGISLAEVTKRSDVLAAAGVEPIIFVDTPQTGTH